MSEQLLKQLDAGLPPHDDTALQIIAEVKSLIDRIATLEYELALARRAVDNYLEETEDKEVQPGSNWEICEECGLVMRPDELGEIAGLRLCNQCQECFTSMNSRETEEFLALREKIFARTGNYPELGITLAEIRTQAKREATNAD